AVFLGSACLRRGVCRRRAVGPHRRVVRVGDRDDPGLPAAGLMGLLVDGVWKDVPREAKDGAFVRAESAFRDGLSRDGPFTPQAGRYHLYVARSCPWAHRTLIVRAMKGLEKAIPAFYATPGRFD